MRNWVTIAARLLFGVFFVLSSLYCLLGFIPYTYVFLIKAPPYAWLVWFPRVFPWLYWAAVIAWLATTPLKRSRLFSFSALGFQLALGIYVTMASSLARLRSDGSAYLLAIAMLVPLALASVAELRKHDFMLSPASERALFRYTSLAGVGLVATLVSFAGMLVRRHLENQPFHFSLREFELLVWVCVASGWVAILIASVLNAVQLLTNRIAPGRWLSRPLLAGLCAVVILRTASIRFMRNTLSFQGWRAEFYGLLLALAITLFAESILLALARAGEQEQSAQFAAGKKCVVLVAAALVPLGVLLPGLIGDGDWNGIIQSTFSLLLWTMLGIAAFLLWPKTRRYSPASIVAIVLVSGCAYAGMKFSAVVWAKALGSTDEEISWTLANHAEQDVSFDLIQAGLHVQRREPCDEFCRTLRQFTNIRDARITRGIPVSEHMVPAAGKRPDIFIFVIDSLRPDYLGAYNPRVHFTPQLDAFARDSVVWKNAFTQYAGTSLSEPAIWSGTLLLHSHYMMPFAQANNLEQMAQTDGYQLVVSYDNVLKELLSPSDGAIKLDTDKPRWNNLEISSTLEQLKDVLNRRSSADAPVLFYAQPMNVHGAADNPLPRWSRERWRGEPEFSQLTSFQLHQVDSFLGAFFGYLKAKGLYENSIIVITSDHGEGPRGHSAYLDPTVMRVPLMIHIPKAMRSSYVQDEEQVATLTDITPTLYYLLGHRPVNASPLVGRPLFALTGEELRSRQRSELFLASDSRAAFGIVENGRWLYATDDSPARSTWFDLRADPDGHHNLLTDAAKKKYDERILGYLRLIAEAYGYIPAGGRSTMDTNWARRSEQTATGK